MSVGQRGLPCMTTLTFANSAINVSLCPIAYLKASSGRRICFVGMRHPTCALHNSGITVAPPHLRPALRWNHCGAPPLAPCATVPSQRRVSATADFQQHFQVSSCNHCFVFGLLLQVAPQRFLGGVSCDCHD